MGSRLQRETATVIVMIRDYCRGHHGGESPCPSCRELEDYARERLSRCPFGDGKTTCAKCAVHCYLPERRTEIRAVMRYAGPRMIFRHPVMAVRHLIDGRRKTPLKKEKGP